MKKERPKISVIVPSYNSEKYIEECLDSICNQTFTDFELILVDDGSTDNTSKICDLYASGDERIKVVHQENCGVSSARNKGVSLAQGEYLLFVDSDDYYMRNDALELLNSIMSSHPDIIVFGYEEISGGKRSRSFARMLSRLKMNYESGEAFLLDACRINKIYPWYLWQYAYKREYWNRNGWIFPDGFVFEDVNLLWRIILLSENIQVCRENLYAYRMTEGSIGGTFNYNQLFSAFTVLDDNMRALKNEDISEPVKELLSCSFSWFYFYNLLCINKLENSNERKDLFQIAGGEIYDFYGKHIRRWRHTLLYVTCKVLGIKVGSAFWSMVKN